MDTVVQYYNEGRWGDLASIAGLLISLLGFAITVWQARRARTAAERASQAVAQVKKDLAVRMTAADFGAILAILDEVKLLHRRFEWELLATRYTGLRKSLIEILVTGPDLTSDHRAVLQGATQQFLALENEVEAIIANQTQPDIPRLNKIVSRQVDKLQLVLKELERQIGE